MNISARNLIPKHTIPDRKTVRSTPGLEDLDWPNNPECNIILGVDYISLFIGERHPMSSPQVIIEKTPIGTKIGGILGSEKLKYARENKIKSLKAQEQYIASINTCVSYPSSPTIPDCMVSQNISKKVDPMSSDGGSQYSTILNNQYL